MTKQSFIDSVSARLTREEPAQLVPRASASVAVILRSLGAEEEVLLIERAKRQDDPWSGHVAFPGGMVSPKDKSFEETARREAAEEVGVDLSSNAAVFLGYMHELKTRMREIVVVPSIFKLEVPTAIRLSEEVASYEWVPLGRLARKEARAKYILRRRDGTDTAFPSLVHDGLVVWGMTERILSAIIETEGEAGDPRLLGEVGRY